MTLSSLFAHPKPMIGVVHLSPLPGSPRNTETMQQITTRALLDAETLVANGIDGLIVENYGDTPFLSGRVDAHTIAAMSIAVREIRSRMPDIPVGVNILRNDARSALAVATVCAAHFIRVNVHTGAMLTDQGIIEGQAGETLRYRSELRSAVCIFADVAVKHAVPLAPVNLADSARDTFYRGHADALIVTGAATGAGTSPNDLRTVREAVPEASLFAGSGVTAETLPEILRYASGAIVGTALKYESRTSNAVDGDRVQAFIQARNNAM